MRNQKSKIKKVPYRKKTKHKKIFISLLVLNFIFAGGVLGNTVTDKSAIKETDIFPFADSSKNRTIEYTQDLYEVTDNGMYDSQGSPIRIVDVDNPKSDAKELKKAADSNDEILDDYSASIIANWGDKKSFTQYRLNDIKRNLKDEIGNYNSLKKTIDDIQAKFKPTQRKIDNLKNQIDLLNQQLTESDNKIQNTELQIAEKQIDLRKLMKDMKQKELLFEIQKKIALDYIVLVYQEEEKFLDYYSEGASTLKLLLADNSVSENLLGIEYSKVLEETGRKVFYDLYAQKTELAEKQDEIQNEQEELDKLNKSLSQEKKILEQSKKSQKVLLEKTLGEEEEYKKLLEESIQQQLESSIAIQNMKDSIEFIEGKLKVLDESAEKAETLKKDTANQDKNKESESKIKYEIQKIDKEVQKEFQVDLDKQIESIKKPFIWPVAANFITAYFHDPSYPAKWGVHNAIDIRAKQFTEIRAPANGYVFQAKDNDMGYSYIILAHKNKFVTVYGHVTEILAKPGTTVKQGDVIGLTGGTPGTKGAGWQTTGPHLHFEVWHEGVQVDPLDWLPLDELPKEYIPKKYTK